MVDGGRAGRSVWRPARSGLRRVAIAAVCMSLVLLVAASAASARGGRRSSSTSTSSTRTTSSSKTSTSTSTDQTTTITVTATTTPTTTTTSTTTTSTSPTTTTTTTSAATTSTAAAASQLELVPAYFYPDWWDTPNDWYEMCAPAGGGQLTAVMNPNSGPSTSANADYQNVIAYCHAQGQRVIGYVHTSYGTRSLAKVEADIDAYYRFYPGIDGIFVDEMSNDSTTKSYYQAVYAYVHAKPGADDVVGNPGTPASTGWQLTTPVADQVVIFEGAAADYLSWHPPAWTASFSPSKFSNMVYAAATVTAMQQVCAYSKTVRDGWIYVTDGVLPNPYGALPESAFWAGEVSAC
jgi:hypothetical protein